MQPKQPPQQEQPQLPQRHQDAIPEAVPDAIPYDTYRAIKELMDVDFTERQAATLVYARLRLFNINMDASIRFIDTLRFVNDLTANDDFTLLQAEVLADMYGKMIQYSLATNPQRSPLSIVFTGTFET